MGTGYGLGGKKAEARTWGLGAGRSGPCGVLSASSEGGRHPSHRTGAGVSLAAGSARGSSYWLLRRLTRSLWTRFEGAGVLVPPGDTGTALSLPVRAGIDGLTASWFLIN